MILSRVKQPNHALMLHKKVLKLRMESLGIAHPATFDAAQELAASNSLAGRHEEAAEAKREVAERHRQILGPDNLLTINSVAS